MMIILLSELTLYKFTFQFSIPSNISPGVIIIWAQVYMFTQQNICSNVMFYAILTNIYINMLFSHLTLFWGKAQSWRCLKINLQSSTFCKSYLPAEAADECLTLNICAREDLRHQCSAIFCNHTVCKSGRNKNGNSHYWMLHIFLEVNIFWWCFFE